MRTITSETITRTVKNLCLRANKFLPSDIKLTLDTALDYEISPNGKRAIHSIIENYKMSQHTSLPICQDTGMVVVFAEIGQDVHIVGELFEDAVNEGVRQAYRDGNLRKSVVNDPLNRQNSEDNTPAIIHTRLVPGNSITLTVIPQGSRQRERKLSEDVPPKCDPRGDHFLRCKLRSGEQGQILHTADYRCRHRRQHRDVHPACKEGIMPRPVHLQQEALLHRHGKRNLKPCEPSGHRSGEHGRYRYCAGSQHHFLSDPRFHLTGCSKSGLSCNPVTQQR